jgi:hypothetical protein
MVASGGAFMCRKEWKARSNRAYKATPNGRAVTNRTKRRYDNSLRGWATGTIWEADRQIKTLTMKLEAIDRRRSGN